MSAGDWKEMYKAATSGDLGLVQYHIQNGVDPNYQHPEILSTPLVAAIIAGHVDIAKFLLENGADPCLRSEFDNLTPAQAAKRYDRQDVLQWLQEKSATQTWLQKMQALFKFK
ncbi:ankyrin repeat domain-containing protein [Bdellovibrio sp. HCB337]|uniref:ankyrin repeat domain-containing protein n=1 Tax=Bdellovibrio sp. HCB337 TaxID=3394358 RepID=UPI0039A5E7FD